MFDLLKFLIIVPALFGLLVLLLKWMERRILAKTDSTRSFEPFSMAEHLRASGEETGAEGTSGAPVTAVTVSPEPVGEAAVASERTEATCPCCGQPVKRDEG